jgi:uncharacterized protein
MADQIFMITALDHPVSTDKRANLRPDHLHWIGSLGKALMLAGPLRETVDGPVIGSHLLILAKDEAALKDMLAKDPYALGDLFASVTIAHFQPVAGTWLET